MRIADAVLDARTVPVPFAGGNVLTVTYRMASATPADMSRMVKEAEAAEEAKVKAGKNRNAIDQAAIDRMVQSMVDLLVSWDLTDYERDENGEIVEGSSDDHPVPVTFAALQHVPSLVFGEIMKAVTRDQKASGEADETSAGG